MHLVDYRTYEDGTKGVANSEGEEASEGSREQVAAIVSIDAGEKRETSPSVNGSIGGVGFVLNKGHDTGSSSGYRADNVAMSP